jgi:alkylation response protein AidB-like acyl-CoA dehydrogenase
METFFWWSEEQKKLAIDMKNLVDELMPQAEEAVWKKDFPWDVTRKLAGKGCFGAGISKEYGGMGLGTVGACIVVEEMSRIPGVGMGIVAASMLGGVHQISSFGNEEQKRNFMTRAAKGELGAIALTEPFAGTDAASIETFARREGDYYVVNGKKRFVTGVGTAGRYILYARTSDSSEDIRRNKHITGFVLEKGMPGFTIEKVNELIGIDNIPNGYLDLNDVHIPVANRIGEEGQGWQILVSGLNYERLLVACQVIGGYREILKNIVSYAQRRVQFGQPTINIPINQFKISDMLMNLKLARLATHYTAYLLDIGQEAAVEASISKLFGTDILMHDSIEAVEVMGGDGVTKFYSTERYLRDAKILQIAGGTSETMKLVIFRKCLKEMSDELKMPYRVINQTLGVPVLSATPPEKHFQIDEHILIKVLAEDYRVNPGLYMSKEDLKQHFDVSNEDMNGVLLSLEEKKLVKLYRRRGIVEMVKATFEGLKKANPEEYYRWFPSWVRKEDIF